jgi:hypothetical protein
VLQVVGKSVASRPGDDAGNGPLNAGGSMATIPMPAALDRLRALCGGAAHLPGEPGYQAVRATLAAGGRTPRPAAILYPGDESEVSDALRYIASIGLRVLVQRTGLGPRPPGPLHDAVLLRTSGLGGVHAAGGHLVVRAGALCSDVAASAARSGLAIPTGDPRHGAVGGTTLGPAGVRQTIAGARAVLADGSVIGAGPQDDLTRALRGGVLPAALVTELLLCPADSADGGTSRRDAHTHRRAVRDAIDPAGLFLLPP